MPLDSWRRIWPRAHEAVTNFATSSQAAAVSALQRSTNWRRPQKHTGEQAAAHFSATLTAVCTARIARERWAAKSTRTLNEAWSAEVLDCWLAAAAKSSRSGASSKFQSSFVRAHGWRYHLALHHATRRSYMLACTYGCPSAAFSTGVCGR